MTEIVQQCLQSLYLIKHIKESMLQVPSSSSSINTPSQIDLNSVNGVGKHASTCIRLCQRCEKFTYIQYLLNNKNLITLPYQESLEELSHILQDVLIFLEVMLQRVLDSEVISTKFRLQHAKEISNLTLPLYEMEQQLLLASVKKEIDIEEERYQHKIEDLEDFMEFFAWSLTMLLEEMEVYYDELIQKQTRPSSSKRSKSTPNNSLKVIAGAGAAGAGAIGEESVPFDQADSDQQMLLLHQQVHGSKQVMSQIMFFFKHDDLSLDEQEHLDVQIIQLHFKINLFHRSFYIRHQLLPSAIFLSPSLIRSLLTNDLTLTGMHQLERDLVLDALVVSVTTIQLDSKELLRRNKELYWFQGEFGGEKVAIVKVPPSSSAGYISATASGAGANAGNGSPITLTSATRPTISSWKAYEDELLILNYLHGGQYKTKEIIRSYGYFIDRNYLHVLYSDRGFGTLQDLFTHLDAHQELLPLFPITFGLAWMQDLLAGIQHLQLMKIKHNFLLPLNILITHQWKVTICNFQAATSYQPKQEVSIKAPSLPIHSRRKSPRIEALQYAISSFNPDLAVYTKDGPSDIYAFGMLALSMLCLQDVSQLGEEKERIQQVVYNIDEGKLLDRDVLADLLFDCIKTEVEGLPPTSRPTAAELVPRFDDYLELHGGDLRLQKKGKEYKAMKVFETAFQEVLKATSAANEATTTNTPPRKEKDAVETVTPKAERNVSKTSEPQRKERKPSVQFSDAPEIPSEPPTRPETSNATTEQAQVPHGEEKNIDADELLEHDEEPPEETEERAVPLESLTATECLSLLKYIGCSHIHSATDLNGAKLVGAASLADLVALGIALPSGVRASKTLEYLQYFQQTKMVPLTVLASDPLEVIEEQTAKQLVLQQVAGTPRSNNSQSNSPGKDGYGLRILPEGVYEGNLVNNMRDGIGTMRYHTGDVYEGEWMLDVRQGQGVMMYANGDRFEGIWDKGTFRGGGTYNFRV